MLLPLKKQKTTTEAKLYHRLFCLATKSTATGVPFLQLLGHPDVLG